MNPHFDEHCMILVGPEELNAQERLRLQVGVLLVVFSTTLIGLPSCGTVTELLVYSQDCLELKSNDA